MTYIKKLQADLAAANERAQNRAERIEEFRKHLNSAKFKQQSDGERADWIATKDVLEWLNYINYFNE
jgi:hypothetical protein